MKKRKKRKKQDPKEELALEPKGKQDNEDLTDIKAIALFIGAIVLIPFYPLIIGLLFSVVRLVLMVCKVFLAFLM